MASSELGMLLKVLGRSGFVNHEMRMDRDGPDVLGFVRSRDGYADVVILFDQDQACAWRTVSGPEVDVFAPEVVTWFYAADPAWTLRAMLTLPLPGHPNAPREILSLPPGYALPKNRLDERVRMRPRHGDSGS